MAISSPGIGSNLDVNGIISKLMQVESQPLTTLARKEASYQAKLSAFGNLNGALASFQTAVASLNSPAMFQSLNATVADSTIFTAAATSKAVAGTYSINVTQLAQAQTISSAGQADVTAAIGAGAATTLSFQFGTISGGTLTNGVYTGATFTQDASQPTGTLTIDASNNSLQGIRDAVNAANIGVTATIVADGSAVPNHLVFTSSKTGAPSSMKISVSGDASINSLLAYDPAATQNMTQSSAAQSAALTVNGIAVSSASNTVSDAIQGVTLNLAKIGASNLTVARNTASVESGVNAFVKAYNDFNAALKNLTGYDAETKQGGPLLGDSTARNIQAQVRKMLSTALTGVDGSLTTLSQIGVSFQKDGTLALDATKLKTALTNNFDDIGKLFASMGSATDSLVSFSSSTSATKAGAYALDVTALSTRGVLTGDKNLNLASTVIDASTTLNVTVDGTSATVALTAGTYTAAQLATLVQSAINGSSALSAAGSSVTASIDASGFLNVQSSRYGSASNISITSGTGTSASALTGTITTGSAGVDVAGTINGVATTGSGQYLSGATGSPTEGLKLQITGGALGARGNVSFSNGYAAQLDELVDSFLGSSGLVSGRTDGLNRSIEDVNKTRDLMNTRLLNVEKRYRAQFTALDTLISSMSTTSNFLSQQLAQINNLSK